MPKTLLKIAGIAKKQINLDNCNLLLIDMQNQYFIGDVNLNEAGKMLLKKAKMY